ncbi:hypothetical protein [Curtobacterium sp. ISL-83]|uniref:hypothetical protein n=1 Tax=Curtobacterium sp. ISL-83 TaxID=2819145 RepID=UPI001BE739A2|nr:hypothetical protein [Curtobacterium sp. ISL-83]MBT2502179.1 hypothetical protein [Curtobacterium sp. ISL-83]
MPRPVAGAPRDIAALRLAHPGNPLWRRDLWLTIGVHAVWNATEALLGLVLAVVGLPLASDARTELLLR